MVYNFHYNEIKAKYGNKASLLFTDTNSLMYEIETEDVYKDIFERVYDLSNNNKNSFCLTKQMLKPRAA